MRTIRFVNKGNKTAEILLYGEVGPVFWGDEISAKDFAKELKDLGSVDHIDLRINSFGGDVFDGIAIHRQLVDHPATITTHIDGSAQSIAAFIAMAGQKIIIAESGMMMIHNAWTIAMGNAATFRDLAERLDAVSNAIASAFVARSGLDDKKVKKWMDEEKEFYGAEAVEAGLADEVAANVRMAARAKPDWDEVRKVLARRWRDDREEAGAGSAEELARLQAAAAEDRARAETPNRDSVHQQIEERRARLITRS